MVYFMSTCVLLYTVGQNIVRRTLPALPAATEHRQTERTVAVDNGGIYSLFVGFRTCYGGYLADMTRQTAQKMVGGDKTK